jgi:hypothetical protein
MKNLLLATAAGLALTLTVAPTFAASTHSSSHHSGATYSKGNSNYGTSCEDILANPSAYSRNDVRACE